MQDKEFVPNCCAGIESCDSDTDSGEDEQSSAAVSIDFLSESDQSVSQNTAGQVNARNGTVWKNITGAPGLGRASSSNVFSERPGQSRSTPTSGPPKVSARAPAHRSYHFSGVKLKRCIKKIHHNLYISKQANVRIKHADTEGASHKKFGTDARVQ